MKQSLIKKTSAVLSFVMLTSICTPAAAGFIEDFFDDVWVQTTDPKVYNTQKRGGLIGGSISVRIPNKSISVINFTPPSFEAGCGGVDLNFGSFGFIDGQELIELLKRIGQQAKALLFQIAVETLNQMIGSLMKEFAAKVQAMNDLLRNSCDIAQGSANAFAGLLGDEDRMAAASTFWSGAISKAEGIFTDWDGVKNAYTEGKNVFKNKTSGGADRTEQNNKNPALGNLSWRAMSIGNSMRYMQFGAAKAGSSDYNKGLAMTLLMNVIGTSVTPNMDDKSEDECKSVKKDSGTADGTPTAGDAATTANAGCTAAPTMIVPKFRTVAQLAEPTDILLTVCKEDGIPTDPQSTSWSSYIYLLGVDVNSHVCKEVAEGAVNASVVFPGTKAMTNKLLFGVSSANLTTEQTQNPSSGVVAYLIGNVASLNNDEIKVLNNLEIPVLAMLKKVQRKKQAVIMVASLMSGAVAQREALRMARSFEIAALNVFVEAKGRIKKPDDYEKNLKDWSAAVKEHEAKYGDREVFAIINEFTETTDKIYRSFEVSATGVSK